MGLVNIEGDEIVIRIPIESIPSGFLIACDRNFGGNNYEVSDLNVFAKELVEVLNAENEIGETPIHYCLDNACVFLVEYGAQGIKGGDLDD